MEIDWDKIHRVLSTKVNDMRCPLCASQEFGGGTALLGLKVLDYERHNGTESSEKEKDAVARNASMLEAQVHGPHIADPGSLYVLNAEVLASHRAALIRLADEIDQLRASLGGGDGNS